MWQNAKPALPRATLEIAITQISISRSYLGDSSVFPVVSQSQGSPGQRREFTLLCCPSCHLAPTCLPNWSLTSPWAIQPLLPPQPPQMYYGPPARPCLQVLLPEGLSQFIPKHIRRRPKSNAPPWGGLLHPSRPEAVPPLLGLDMSLDHSLRPPESGRGQPDSGHSRGSAPAPCRVEEEMRVGREGREPWTVP